MNETTNTTPELSSFDFIVINTSAGKDSQAMLDFVVRQAEAEGINVRERIIAVHCDLGQIEWQGTRELAIRQCKHYGIELHVVSRTKGDLLQQVEERKMWPDNQNRYCTSDQKRDQVAKLHTAITNQKIAEMADFWAAADPELPIGKPRQVRILNCMGLRAEESPARAKKVAYTVNKRQTNGKRLVMDWLPIHEWSVKQVWDTIKASGVPYHHAYDRGMPRLSCMFCVFAPKSALVIAGFENKPLLEKYVALEAKIGHTFRNGFKIADVLADVNAGIRPKIVESWACSY